MNRRLFLSFIASVLLLLVFEPAYSQRRNRSNGSSKTPAVKNPPVIDADPLIFPNDPKAATPAKRTFKHDGKFETKYDRFEDETIVRVGITLSKPSNPNYEIIGPILSMVAGFSYRGQVLQTSPRFITLGFQLFIYVGNRRFQGIFNDNDKLIVLADGERLTATMRREVLTDNAGGIYENASTSFDYLDFLRIANSKNVEMRAGTREIKLSENDLEALRDLASRTVP
jgi:hypothetical protein